MRRILCKVMMFAALTMAVGACTVEDVKETRAADSVAALTSKTPPTSAVRPKTTARDTTSPSARPSGRPRR